MILKFSDILDNFQYDWSWNGTGDWCQKGMYDWSWTGIRDWRQNGVYGVYDWSSNVNESKFLEIVLKMKLN